MPEPVTLIVGGIALYSMLKAKNVTPTPAQVAEAPATATADLQPISAGAAGTGPGAPLATATGTANYQEAGVTLATVMQTGTPIPAEVLPPADLVAALDNDTALRMREYARLNPADFQAFLDRYADRVVLRNDLVMERLTDPPTANPMQPTPGMLVGMGTAAYQVVQAINGVAAGKSIDVFGLGASVAGQIPGVNADFVSSLQGLAMGYRIITSITDVMTIAANAGVSITDLSALTALGGTAGAYAGLAALPISGVLMAVGLVVDIGFTIIGDKPDLQKAIDVALDVASLAVLFIPVIGIVIAIVIQLVKFIIDLFGADLFGGGMTHEQREVLETARYGTNLDPMFPSLAAAYTPRELWRAIIEWGSGYCGGVHVVAMSVALYLRAGDVVPVGGQPYTVPADTLLSPGRQPCYWLASTPFAAMTDDEQAWAFGAYASVNGIFAMAQAGIADWRKEQFNDPTEKLIMARAQPMHDFLVKHRLTLDQIDQIAAEYRAQPHLNDLAAAFGWDSWQELFGSVVDQEWRSFGASVANGTLSDFARRNGYPTMYAFRAAALGSHEGYFARLESSIARAKATAAANILAWPTAYVNPAWAAGSDPYAVVGGL